jgi:hypothetical protein
MRGFSSSVLSCLERERLEEELSEARVRGRNLSRLRQLTSPERATLDQREQAAQTRLRDHDAEHGDVALRNLGPAPFGVRSFGFDFVESSG